ncbi:MAG: glutamine--fructose-6-phosphate transaminase (isomerizing) [Armatimonadota bacterium]|nr:MAG: glutamine--fructose-6-phosphate transaminase (isomerizing) [Armatimonadota bacterium]
MCGIMGYLGERDTVEVLLEGLRRLEYRGYDSAGVAVLVDGKVEVVKAKGKISVLEEVLEGKKPEGSVGIAHTRWATHGPPSKKNAHPHADCKGHIAIVHNGIIENYLELREKLQAEGHKFRSETDTETLAHLFEKYYDGDLEKAVRRGLKEVKGSYAVVAISDRDPGVLIAARQYSPLIVGLGEKPGENFVASDPSAILSFTRKAYLIDNGEMVVLTRDRVEVKTLAGKAVKKSVFHIEWDAEMAEKGGHKHFMIKEIFEQPHALRETIGERIAGGEAALKLDRLNLTDAYLRRVKKVAIIACGTASYAGMAVQYALEKLCGVPVMVDVASELQHRECVFDKETLGIAISQSGETADTLQAMRMARRQGAKLLAITNVIGSSVARESNGVLYIHAGPEIGVASTKAYTSQIMAMLLFCVHLGLVRGTIKPTAARRLLRGMKRLPDQAEEFLEGEAAHVEELARKYKDVMRYLYLGRGAHYCTAMEGALKIKEIAYLDAEGYAAGEMKHGPLALVTEEVGVLSAVVEGPHYEKSIGNLQEIRARGGKVIAVANEGDEEIQKYADDVIRIPKTEEVLSPVLAGIPMQLYAYYVADLWDREIDQPRNLAKSVTVE